MANNRTKQQVAWDGVRTAWQGDAFTEILHRQTTQNFSMDGVVPQKHTVTRLQRKEPQMRVNLREESVARVQEGIGRVIQHIDGVRLPWKRAYISSETK
jgi:hypothetical protein